MRPLSTAIGLALVGLGAGAFAAPAWSSRQYGVPASDAAALAYVRATGARDVILGALVLGALGDRAALRRTLASAAGAGLADAAVLALGRGWRPQHVVHLGGFGALALAALALGPGAGESSG